MFREEIIDILNKNKPLRSDYDTYYFLYKINADESLVKVDRDDIEDVANRISEALSPYNIDEGELLLPYKIVVYEFFNDCLAIKKYDCTYKVSNINVIFDYVSMRRTKSYGADSIRLIYFDNLAVVTKMKNGKFISLPISMPIDYLPSNESLILKCKDFLIARDFVRESEQYSKVENKTTTFRNEYWFYIYASYVVSRCKISLPEKYVEDGFYMGMSLLKDTMNMLAKLKEKSEVSVRSIDGLRRYHDEVLARYLELENKISKKKIKLTKEWKHIKDNLEKSSLNVTILDSEHLLAEEGKHMKNCVHSYYDFVKSGNSFIFHVDYKRRGYCCELKINEGSPYIAQPLGACNSDDVPKNLVDKITKTIERKNNG